MAQWVKVNLLPSQWNLDALICASSVEYFPVSYEFCHCISLWDTDYNYFCFLEAGSFLVQGGLELSDPFPSTSQALVLQVCTPLHSGVQVVSHISELIVALAVLESLLYQDKFLEGAQLSRGWEHIWNLLYSVSLSPTEVQWGTCPWSHHPGGRGRLFSEF